MHVHNMWEKSLSLFTKINKKKHWDAQSQLHQADQTDIFWFCNVYKNSNES
jgi:hypothetical protein